ncbi:hypothetical protein Q2T41_14790 [Maribacter confluentis]|uniref:Uncharacterized protein n=1 Tax=Maribacter confluentis TaxID=1656093 RepID=A0ABT8RSM2_9FLAO|nr:hypothetical protein [Maribacter confluentis]MDO1513926.1 hypothetical protein [Maribacter confluentis]
MCFCLYLVTFNKGIVKEIMAKKNAIIPKISKTNAPLKKSINENLGNNF